MEKKDVELLSPAGSFTSMRAAFAAGADAVYMGGAKFGARAYAENAEDQQLIDAINYAHIREKKLYLTVNTLFKEEELNKELYPYLAPLYEAGLDAVIVQDVGTLFYLRKQFPDLHIHASTQMTITGAAGARLMEEMGCTRIVTARELSLSEIAMIRDTTSLEIESFVHGALCYCYSGQCLMSSFFGGRSGNRGRCAQPCRLPYSVSDEQGSINDEHSQYTLSPKDMCTVELLPEIIQAGVTSLKIEGRMKKPEYTAGVTRIYRKYLDMYQNQPNEYHVSDEDLKELYDLYNRDGFHKGYYQVHNGPSMMAVKNEKLSGTWKVRNESLFTNLKKQYVDQTDQIAIQGQVTLSEGQPARMTVDGIDVSFGMVDQAQKRPITQAWVKEQVEKTGNTPYYFSKLEIHMDDNIFVPMQTMKELRRMALVAVEARQLEKFRRKPIEKISLPETLESKTQNASWDSLEVTVETKAQLNVALASPWTKKIYASLPLFYEKGTLDTDGLEAYISETIAYKKEPCLALPYVTREDSLDPLLSHLQKLFDMGLSEILVRNMESLALLRENGYISHVTIDANLYTYNNMAKSFYQHLGVKTDTIPMELNSHELEDRNNTNSACYVYGYVPLMISAQCLKKNLRNCTQNSEVLTLQDRYKKNFCVKCVCDFCYNVIYNSVPLALWKEESLISHLQVGQLRLSFTLEDETQTEEILGGFASVFIKKKPTTQLSEIIPEYTKGHFKRGVE